MSLVTLQSSTVDNTICSVDQVYPGVGSLMQNDTMQENLFANGAVIGGSEPLTDAIAKAMTQVSRHLQTTCHGVLHTLSQTWVMCLYPDLGGQCCM